MSKYRKCTVFSAKLSEFCTKILRLGTLFIFLNVMGFVNPMALLEGDFIIGALYSLHHQPEEKKAIIHQCGKIRETYGIQRTEVTFQTLDKINNDKKLLPNVKLGAEIRDSCWYAPVALKETIEFVRDNISPTCQMDTLRRVQISGNVSTNEQQPRSTLIGVVGPGSSSVAIQVQNLLQLFGIPQVAYSATSKDLSDKARYRTFMRVVPSDLNQAKVLIDILIMHNWTYVSAINTDENYGISGIQAFRQLAENNNICIAKENTIQSTASPADYEKVIDYIREDKKAKVVICFCEGMTVRRLLMAERRLNLTEKLFIIGSDGWADREEVVKDYEQEARGSMSVKIYSPHVKSFDDYYFKLKPSENTRNTWFKEFWQDKFDCQFPDNRSNSTKKECTENESLAVNYTQDAKMSYVIKAIYTMAHGLHNMIQQICGGKGACKALYPFNGTLFNEYLMNVTFQTEDNEIVSFDESGDSGGRYEILNYQLLNGSQYAYIRIGDWMNGTLTLNGTIQYGLNSEPPVSVCSSPCLAGHYRNYQSGGQDKQCCWSCVECQSGYILINDSTCEKCPYGTYPDTNKTYCYDIPVKHVMWSDTEAIVAMFFSFLGFLTTAFTAIIFIQHNNTPVVKASTRELSYLILVGMTFSHAATFPILAKPAPVTCALSRTVPGISFAIIYASLLTKTKRIATILAGHKKRIPITKPRFMSGTAQVVISFLLIGIEVIISVVMLFLEPANTETVYHELRGQLRCNTSTRGVLAPLAFDFLLIGMCTLYAVKTRNVPENFNEAKFIGFAMYTTCVIWVAFVPIYFGSETKIITMCMCVTLSAIVTLIFLFTPKLYIMIFRPEKNNRSLFKTSKDIRCHIGSRVASAISEKSYSSFSSLGKGQGMDSPHIDYHHQDKTTIIQKHKVNWSDKKDCLKKDYLHQNRRTLSCQTGNELLECLLEEKYNINFNSIKDMTDWVELNPKTLMDTQTKSNHNNITNAKLSANSPNLKIKQPTNSLLNLKARIREESISECSLSDEDMTQIKSITITLGSTNSINSNSFKVKENSVYIPDTDFIQIKKPISELSIPQ